MDSTWNVLWPLLTMNTAVRTKPKIEAPLPCSSGCPWCPLGVFALFVLYSFWYYCSLTSFEKSGVSLISQAPVYCSLLIQISLTEQWLSPLSFWPWLVTLLMSEQPALTHYVKYSGLSVYLHHLLSPQTHIYIENRKITSSFPTCPMPDRQMFSENVQINSGMFAILRESSTSST